tara:strand:- start:44510 stop:49168 length:4659 start_codon:yes stop_codon:yes gene_type:complete
MTNKQTHTFDGGMKSDLDNHLKTKNSFIFGENGRLSAKDGMLSFVSVKGTEEIMNDTRIVKYLGAASFNDQLVVFVKASGIDINIGGVIYESVNRTVPNISDFEVELNSGAFALTDEISDNSNVVTYTEQIASKAPDSEVVIEDNYDPSGTENDEIDYDSYYRLNVNVNDFAACQLQEGSIPPNNELYSDCILSITKDDNGNFTNKVLWAGYQNWALDAKIVALGVDENSNYRRVKYTDFTTTFKSINVYDPDLKTRSPKELENFQSSTLLEPRIKEVNTNGQLKSMAVQYLYRLITDNGQVTNLSPYSKVHYIYPENSVAVQGGEPEEVTNKAVKITCNIVNPTGFSEIECIALEFEASGIPTGVKSLGIKAVSSVVEFDHFGNESDLSTEITFADTLQNELNWKYCSDLETKNNKLFAFGLRNNPITNEYNSLKTLFALHGWNSAGNTHSSFLNPSPKTYNLIPPNYKEELFYAKKRVFSEIRSFGSTTVRLVNTLTSEQYEYVIENEANVYKNVTEEIGLLLQNESDQNVEFGNKFPNVIIKYIDNVILLNSVNDNLKTDMTNIILSFSNEQVLYETEDENVFFTDNLSSEQMVHGALSAGFNSGTGIRISYRLEEDKLLNKATSRYNGNGSVLDMPEPTLKKGFMKNEIYRLAIQLYQNGEPIFAIPMGDVHIPKLGTSYSYINDSGNAVITSKQYVNQKVVNNSLYGVRVEMHIETRFDCNFSKQFDSYQILFVERDENNRGVICQGISAPLMRLQDPVNFAGYGLDEKLQRKWILPYHGGPLFDKEGFDQYDDNGEDYDNPNYEYEQRVINNRKLFYFDCPDLVYGEVSDSLVLNSKLHVVGRLNTDHSKNALMTSGESFGAFPLETFPKFSRKILREELNTPSIISDLPKLVGDDRITNNSTWQTHFVNVSVFSNYTLMDQEHDIKEGISLGRGEVVPGSDLGTNFEISNNAFCLPSMPWWYSNEVRKIRFERDQYGFEALPRGGSLSIGEKTLFIKSEDNLFTDSFLGSANPTTFPTQIRRGESSFNWYDSYALINIERDNEDSIYGGRSSQAFSNNTFIPLSETKPIEKNTNGAQVFNIEGDTYVTLWARTKNSHGDEAQERIDRNLNNGRTKDASARGDLEDVKKLNGAWCYAFVVETMVEPKLNYEYEFYRETTAIDFAITKNEVINSAYLHKNNYKKYIVKPYRYQDDPNMDNIVSASETKLSGEYYDAWSSFPVNEFQELDKNKGAVLNAAKIKNDLFAVQEHQTSLLYVDRNIMIPSEQGQTINVAQSSGKSISGYEVVSSYGTSIRRSLSKHPDFGFMFIDDTKKVIIKNFEEITLKNQYHHDFYNKLNTENIIDVNGFFDEEFKETCLNIVTDTGNSMIMYNEPLGLFSGWREMNSSIYMPFDGKIYIPRETIVTVNDIERPNSQSLHELNKGLYLNVLEKELKMKISFICSPDADETFIFPHLAWVMNDFTDFESITITTKEGHVRQLLPTHKRYKKREGKHTIPTLNYANSDADSDEKKDVRSEWALFEFVFPYNEGTLRKLNRVVNYIRLSYQ